MPSSQLFAARTLLYLCLILIAASPRSASAQGTNADYRNADEIRALSRGHVFRERINANWIRKGDQFYYKLEVGPAEYEYVRVDTKQGTREAAFDHQRLAKALGEHLKTKLSATKLPLQQIDWSEDDKTLFVRHASNWYACDLKSYAVSKSDHSPPAPEQSRRSLRGRSRRRPQKPISPDGKWTAIIRDHNVYLKENASGKQQQLSKDGNSKNFYEPRFSWSPDSSKLVVIKTEKGQEHIVRMVESSPKDQLQPKLFEHQYLKPGDKIPLSRPQLFDIKAKSNISIDDKLFPNPWSVKEIRWQDDSSRFTFLYNQRGHQVLRIIGVNAETGETGLVVDETSPTFIDYAYKKFTHYASDSKELIWMSERDGWNHLYLIHSQTGQVLNQITKGDWVVRGVENVDEENRQIVFRASGVFPEQDPYFIHYCRVNFDGSGFVVLTSGNGTHEIQYSPDRRFLIDRYSRVDQPPRHELRDASSGKLICKLETADISRLMAKGWRAPERFVAKARDNKTNIYGVIVRPRNFSPDKKYPVIEKIYAGPHGSFAPKSFRGYLDTMSIAELGFIVVQMDGMGTSNRSKAFHDVCWKNLGDSGFPDRIRWIKAAAKRYPYMDTTRVGIYGGSAGGQSSTRALLAFGDFYQVAVSDCGCHDNRMDKIWWNELWMSWPVGPHYAEQSNVTNAHKLKGKLLLIVGELDKNVDPASTMQVVNALIKADKDFDMLVIPGGGHGIGGSYGIRRRRDYFVRHLLGVEPRAK